MLCKMIPYFDQSSRSRPAPWQQKTKFRKKNSAVSSPAPRHPRMPLAGITKQQIKKNSAQRFPSQYLRKKYC